ncbi:MAG TPA: ABC transporter permease, partial [Flavilitoribacter sp.]|nr:ABC transporter permease [Flavilitoribacter sp.]
MISNYIKIVLRAIQQNKLSYFLNLFGLSIGIASFLFIFYYVNFELGYDKFNDQQDRIYRVGLDQFKNNELIFESAENYPAVGPALQESFPEVVDFTRLYNAGAKNNVVFYRPEEEGKQGYKVRRFLYADSSFFRIFSFPLLKGDPKTCLSQSKSAVISQSFAEKVFKGEDPMGQSIVMADDDFNQEICKITGVFEDVPADSHLKFDVLASYSSLMTRGRNAVERYDQSWDEKDMYTYVLLKDGTDPHALEAKFPQFMDQHNPELLMMNQEKKIFLQPLSSIHLDSHLADEAEQNGQKQNVLTLVLVGGLILLVAMVNFLNYTVAKSMTRAKDFGLRKTMGAVKKDLYLQFIFEALFHNILAIAFAAGIVVVCLPFFKDLTQLEINRFSEFFLNRSFLYAGGGTLAAGL